MVPVHATPTPVPAPAQAATAGQARVSRGSVTLGSPGLAEPLGDWITAWLFLSGFVLLGLIVLAELLGAIFR